MAGELGYTFAPGSQQIPLGGQRQAGGGPQSAIEVKSFTLPNRFVPGQIAPQALLQSPGGAGGLDVNILQRLMSLFAPQGQQPGVPALGQPQFGPPRNHTQPVSAPGAMPPMQMVPGAPGPSGDVPLTHTPTPTPGVTPGEEGRKTPTTDIINPNIDTRRDLTPAPTQGFDFLTPSGGMQNPLGRNKYEGFNF